MAWVVRWFYFICKFTGFFSMIINYYKMEYLYQWWKDKQIGSLGLCCWEEAMEMEMM